MNAPYEIAEAAAMLDVAERWRIGRREALSFLRKAGYLADHRSAS